MSGKQDPSGRRQFLKQSAGAIAGASALLAEDANKAAGADHEEELKVSGTFYRLRWPATG